MANSKTGDSVLSRLDRVLAAFSPAEDQLSAAEIARRTAIPTATVHRLCQELARHHWLEPRPGGYVIGNRLWEMSNRASPTTKLAVRARPFLTDIHAVIGHHVQLGVVEGREVLFIDRLSAHRAPAIHGGVANRLPLHASATGIVLLAHAAPAFRQFYRDQTLPQNPDARPMISEPRLEQVRREGYCAQTGAIEEDVTGVAVPVSPRGHQAIAGLGVVTDSPEIARRPAPWVSLLQMAARGIQRQVTR